jgi:exodeoxyribonuclease VII small subunit
MANRQPRSTAKGSTNRGTTKEKEATDSIAGDLSYGEARTALDLALAQLQATDLDVEAMAGLFQRAQSYARRCEALLAEVEQQVLLWDSTDATSEPTPYRPEPV